MKRFVAPLIALSLAACASPRMYEGPARPESEVARIDNAAGATNAGQARVCQLDGRTLSPCKSTLELLPGEHSLKLELVKSGAIIQTQYVRKRFRAGDRYLLGTRSSSGGQTGLRFWLDRNINE